MNTERLQYLTELVNSESLNKYYEAAQAIDLPDDLQLILLDSGYISVLYSLAVNHNICLEAQKNIANDCIYGYIRDGLVENIYVDNDVLRILANDRYEEIRNKANEKLRWRIKKEFKEKINR